MGGLSVMLLMSIISFIYIAFIAVAAAVIVCTVINYIFESISVMCILKNMRYNYSFAAWIPFYNKYLLGRLAGNKTAGAILGILNLASASLSVFFYIHKEIEVVLFSILLVCLIIGFILDTFIAYKAYSRATKYCDILTVLTVLSCGLLRPVILFVIRNKIIGTEQ